MKKLLNVLLMLCIGAMPLLQAAPVTVHVVTGGTLKALIEEQVGAGKYLTVANLTVSGALNFKDMATLRTMAQNELALLDMSGCNLTTIEGYAFSSTSLTKIKLPKELISIGEKAFYDCDYLCEITLPASVSYIEDRAFLDSDRFKAIVSEALTPPAIGQDVFPSNVIVYVPEGRYSAYRVASGWKNYSIYNSNAVVTIDKLVSGSLRDRIINEGYSVENVSDLIVTSGFLDQTDFDLIRTKMPKLLKLDIEGVSNEILPAKAFSGAKFRYIILPGGLTTIEYWAFRGCSSMVEVKLPSTLTEIQNSAFDICSSLVSIQIPKGVTRLEAWLFGDCVSLIEVDLPEGLTEIAATSFSGCKSLTSITLPSTVVKISERFSYCKALTEMVSYTIEPPIFDPDDILPSICIVKVPKGSIEKYRAATGWKEFWRMQEIGLCDAVLTYNSGGTVSLNTINQSSGSSIIAESGKSLIFEIEPLPGYRLKSVFYNSENVTDKVQDNKYKTPVITTNINIRIEFEAIVYPVTVMIVDGCVITHEVTAGHNISFGLDSFEDQKIESVTLDGTDITSETMDSKKISLTEVNEARIIVILPQQTVNGVKTSDMDDAIRCWSRGGLLHVTSDKQMERIEIISSQGVVLFCQSNVGYGISIPIVEAGAILLKVKTTDGRTKILKTVVK